MKINQFCSFYFDMHVNCIRKFCIKNLGLIGLLQKNYKIVQKSKFFKLVKNIHTKISKQKDKSKFINSYLV